MRKLFCKWINEFSKGFRIVFIAVVMCLYVVLLTENRVIIITTTYSSYSVTGRTILLCTRFFLLFVHFDLCLNILGKIFLKIIILEIYFFHEIIICDYLYQYFLTLNIQFQFFQFLLWISKFTLIDKILAGLYHTETGTYTTQQGDWIIDLQRSRRAQYLEET